jgi:hypothetical protein
MLCPEVYQLGASKATGGTFDMNNWDLVLKVGEISNFGY